LVMVATLTLARAREIRISFLLFPWAIPFALDWFRTRSGYFLARAKELDYWALAISILAFLAVVTLYLDLAQRDWMSRYLADFRNGYWLVIGTVHLSATLAIFLPMVRGRRLGALASR
jgi:hypothetical protein